MNHLTFSSHRPEMLIALALDPLYSHAYLSADLPDFPFCTNTTVWD